MEEQKINILNNRSIEVTKNNYEKKIQKIRMKDLKFSAAYSWWLKIR